ncbi:MAG: adaptor protein MecA [Clostridia bacterium]|nr:adaptor protein MecA [Clostridia bacterium]
MRVEKTNDNRIDIHLSGTEMKDIFGGYEYIDYNETECRAKIHKIISTLLPNSILPLDCDKLLIEVRPASTGCRISLTKIYEYKNSECKTVSMIFEDSETLILALPQIVKLRYRESSLYESDKKYALICSVSSFKTGEALHICEYAKVSIKEIDAVRINEYWHSICKDEAITKLANAFL